MKPLLKTLTNYK